MLHINDLTYPHRGRARSSTAPPPAIPDGHKVGLVGRNGTGKTTLLRLITGEISARRRRDHHAAAAAHRLRRAGSAGRRRQPDRLGARRRHRAREPARTRPSTRPTRTASPRSTMRLADIDAHAAPARAAQILAGLGFDEDGAATRRAASSPAAGACAWRWPRCCSSSPTAAARRADQLSRPRRHAVARELSARPIRTPSSSSATTATCSTARSTHILHLDRGKLTLYAGGYDDFEEARREKQRLELKLKKKQDDAAPPHPGLHRSLQGQGHEGQRRRRAASRRWRRCSRSPPQVDERVVPFRLPQPAEACSPAR